MLVAKPLQAFAIKDRHIVSCEILLDNPHDFLGKELWFYTSEGDRRQISIKGLSTASDIERHIYDFHYTGAVIRPEEITEHSVITDTTYRQALARLMSAVMGEKPAGYANLGNKDIACAKQSLNR